MAFKIFFAAAVVATGLLTTGAQAAQPVLGGPDGAASIERGRRLAQRNCVQCHAIGPRGESPNAASPPFRELYRRYPAGALEEAFGNGLLTRHPAMPEIRLLPGEIADLTAYVKSLQARSEARARALKKVTG